MDEEKAQGDGQAKADNTFEALEKDFQEVEIIIPSCRILAS